MPLFSIFDESSSITSSPFTEIDVDIGSASESSVGEGGAGEGGAGKGSASMAIYASKVTHASKITRPSK